MLTLQTRKVVTFVYSLTLEVHWVHVWVWLDWLLKKVTIFHRKQNWLIDDWMPDIDRIGLTSEVKNWSFWVVLGWGIMYVFNNRKRKLFNKSDQKTTIHMGTDHYTDYTLELLIRPNYYTEKVSKECHIFTIVL